MRLRIELWLLRETEGRQKGFRSWGGWEMETKQDVESDESAGQGALRHITLFFLL